MPTFNGTPFPDTLIGTDGADVIFGLGSDDNLQGRGGSDLCMVAEVPTGWTVVMVSTSPAMSATISLPE